MLRSGPPRKRPSRVCLLALFAGVLGFACHQGSSPTLGTPAPCAPDDLVPLPQGRSVGHLLSGVCREYVAHVPASYDASRPAPLLIALHGHGGNPTEFETASALSSSSESQGFLLVYPAGTSGGVWHASARSADVSFLRELVAHLERRASVDRRRVYVTGFSGGGGMAHRAACELADVFAAAAPVSAALSNYQDCAPARPVPILTVHGTADSMVLPEGGKGGWPALFEWTGLWVRLDGCEGEPTVVRQTSVTETAWTRCRGDAEVRVLMVDGLEHRWWSAANPDLWRFFARHALP